MKMSMSMQILLIVLISLFFAVTRFGFAGHHVSAWGAWEAFAHLWCGLLIGVGLYGCRRSKAWAWASLGVISLLELAMFCLFFFGG